MKRFILLSIFAILTLSLESCVVSSKPSIDFFDTPQFRNQANFISINVPTFLAKSYLKGQLKSDGESEDVINLVKKVSKVRVMTSENMDSKMMKEFGQYLNDEKFEEWAAIKSDGNLIKINAKQDADIVKKLMIVISSNDNNSVFVDVTGKFSQDDISRLINATENSKIKIK